MAHQDNLNKIAQDFIMMDDLYNRKRRQERQPYEACVQTSYSIWRSYAPPKTTIDCTQAAKRYGGVLVMEGRRKYRF